jgi:DNA primase
MLVGAQKGGFRENELRDAGLAQRGREGRLYDRFRSRIMFPLTDRRGQVLGFGARAMRDGQGPKYLNTSENEIFRKGQQLFGLHLAHGHATRCERIVVVEGYTDVLALHQAGIRDSVAIMGTALTSLQMRLLSQTAKDIVLALDADRSGQEAMVRAAGAGGEAVLRVVEMPEGKDPADLIAAGEADAFRERVENAVPIAQFQVRRVLADADLDSPAGRDRALEEAARLIAEQTKEGSAMRDELVREAADRLDVPGQRVLTAFDSSATAPVRPSHDPGPAFPSGASAGDIAFRTEREFFANCLASGELGRRYLSTPSDGQFSTDVSRRARKHLVTHFDDPLADLPEEQQALGSLVHRAVDMARTKVPVEEGFLRTSVVHLEVQRLEREIRRARSVGDHAQNSVLAAALQQAKRDLGNWQMA